MKVPSDKAPSSLELHVGKTGMPLGYMYCEISEVRARHMPHP